MPLREIMLNLYIAADTHALAILLGSLLWAIAGTLALGDAVEVIA